MKSQILAFLGLVSLLPAQEVATNASPSPKISWTNAPEDCWGDKALPYAQAGLKAWYQESDPKKKAEIAEKVLEFANRADAMGMAEELVAGRPVAEAKLSVPTKSVALPLTVLKEWDLSKNEYGTGYACVIRRIGPKNFELWTPTQGWLFNDKGDVLNEANVPRHDGTGREWYGAFLPDGQWITTDLWDRDDRIYLFSKENKLINSFPAGDIADWGRADSTGTHWVVRTNNDLRIAPWGWKQHMAHWLKRCHLLVPDPSWKFVEKIKSASDAVEPRLLGSRGTYLFMEAVSDDRNASISFDSAGHGQWVGWPRYSMQSHDHSWGMCIPENRGFEGYSNFGFFPDALTSWVGGDKYPLRPTHDYETFNEEFRRTHYYDRDFKSWIIAPDGKVLGWLPAERVGDDPDRKRMWFVDQKGRLLKVAPDGTVSEVMQPTLAGATGPDAPFAHVLFPDLKLGFFYTKPGHLVLARWP